MPLANCAIPRSTRMVPKRALRERTFRAIAGVERKIVPRRRRRRSSDLSTLSNAGTNRPRPAFAARRRERGRSRNTGARRDRVSGAVARAVHGCWLRIETVLAEKIVTMIERGDATTRERDFADVVLITTRHVIDGVTLWAAIRATAVHRQTEMRPLREVLVTLPSARQSDWERFVSRTASTRPRLHRGDRACRRIRGSDPRGEITGRTMGPCRTRGHNGLVAIRESPGRGISVRPNER
jgi:hypothetical protein